MLALVAAARSPAWPLPHPARSLALTSGKTVVVKTARREQTLPGSPCRRSPLPARQHQQIVSVSAQPHLAPHAAQASQAQVQVGLELLWPEELHQAGAVGLPRMVPAPAAAHHAGSRMWAWCAPRPDAGASSWRSLPSAQAHVELSPGDPRSRVLAPGAEEGALWPDLLAPVLWRAAVPSPQGASAARFFACAGARLPST